jgi:cytochrome c oxidase subunit 4
MEQQHVTSPEVTFEVHHDSRETVRKIIRTTVVLSIITLIELALGYGIFFLHKDPNHSHSLVLAIKGVIVILSLAKAFYIVSVFMHLGDEIRNMIMTIVVPLMLFIWFIGAFLWDGNSYKSLRNTYDTHHREQTDQKVTTPRPKEEGHEGGHGEGVKPGAVH